MTNPTSAVGMPSLVDSICHVSRPFPTHEHVNMYNASTNKIFATRANYESNPDGSDNVTVLGHLANFDSANRTEKV